MILTRACTSRSLKRLSYNYRFVHVETKTSMLGKSFFRWNSFNVTQNASQKCVKQYSYGTLYFKLVNDHMYARRESLRHYHL